MLGKPWVPSLLLYRLDTVVYPEGRSGGHSQLYSESAILGLHETLPQKERGLGVVRLVGFLPSMQDVPNCIPSAIEKQVWYYMPITVSLRGQEDWELKSLLRTWSLSLNYMRLCLLEHINRTGRWLSR